MTVAARTELLPVTLGRSGESLTILGMEYESAAPSRDARWLNVDFVVSRDGEAHSARQAFMNTDDLLGLPAWLDELASRAGAGPGSATHSEAGPEYFFEAPVELHALSWSPASVCLRIRWLNDPPWQVDDLTVGDPGVVLHTSPEQLHVFAEALRACEDELPYGDTRFDWVTPLALSIVLLVIALVVIGAVTVIRWLLGAIA